MRRLRSTLALVPALLFAGRALSQALPIDLELGYRFADVSGSDEMYRSQVNERSGFLVRTLSISDQFSGRTGAYDRLRLDVTDLGAGPAGAARLDVSKEDIYKLHVFYRRAELFSALPAFANPLLGAGIVPGQHTYDRTRHLFDAELELLPGKFIRPILGYSLNRASGPGQTTYTVGGDEFRLRQDLTSKEQEFRIGAAFDVGPVSGLVTQGWRKGSEDETLTLVPGAGAGNSAGTVLGTPVTLNDYHSTSSTDINTPVTNAVLTARVTPWLRVLGHYVRARAEGDTGYDEALSGSLVSFALRSNFAGLNETVSSRAKDRYWSGGGRLEASLAGHLDFSVGVTASEHELDGAALISSLFLGAIPFGNVTAHDVQEILEANTKLDRKDAVYFVRLHAKSMGPLAITAGVSQTDQHVDVTAAPEEIVIPGAQEGRFARQIRAYELGFTVSQSGFTIGADTLREKADRPVVRTDFTSRSRYRFRAGYKGSIFSVMGNATRTDADDNWPGIGYGSRWTQYGVDASITPVKMVTLRVGAGVFQLDSNMLYRQPQDFSVVVSNQSESGRYSDFGLALALKLVSLDVSYQSFDNKGTLPVRLGRIRGRAEVSVKNGFGVALEYAKDRYAEWFSPAFGNYDADRYGNFLRYTR
jgi:hypothetical protein